VVQREQRTEEISRRAREKREGAPPWDHMQGVLRRPSCLLRPLHTLTLGGGLKLFLPTFMS
jgi:hypothetical protein